MKELHELGIDARRIEIAVDGSVEENAKFIATQVSKVHQETNRKVVVMGHSKGVLLFASS